MMSDMTCCDYPDIFSLETQSIAVVAKKAPHVLAIIHVLSSYKGTPRYANLSVYIVYRLSEFYRSKSFSNRFFVYNTTVVMALVKVHAQVGIRYCTRGINMRKLF